MTLSEKLFNDAFNKAENKIRLKLWSREYAKGYLYCYLNEVLNVSDDEYDEYSKLIDELTNNKCLKDEV
ncbi:MAG: hypothetical protein IJZ79_03555 [Bacilli bacterium]|nr:hypothetical protein [Bacilli bacterium]MBQ8218805.1 hypothetical protein [Bacilli bacterium]